jgi:hypothetical protein
MLIHINFCHMYVAPCGFPNKHPISFVGCKHKCLPPIYDWDDGVTKLSDACALREKGSFCIEQDENNRWAKKASLFLFFLQCVDSYLSTSRSCLFVGLDTRNPYYFVLPPPTNKYCITIKKIVLNLLLVLSQT